MLILNVTICYVVCIYVYVEDVEGKRSAPISIKSSRIRYLHFTMAISFFVYPGRSAAGQGGPKLSSKPSASLNTSFTNSVQGAAPE